jgi:NADPH2:quinone reductase
VLAVQVHQPASPENHSLAELPDLTAGPGQVVIDVKASAVNYPDLLVVTGRYQTIPPLPFAPGKDAAGTVREVGAGVTGVKPGDRVLVHVEYGAWATQLRIRADQCLPLPAGMAFADAATLGLAAQTAAAQGATVVAGASSVAKAPMS